MPVRVVIRSNVAAPRDDPPSLVFDGPRVVIGRGDGCDVRLPDASVSARHATLRQHGGSYLLCDEGSSNGTFVAGVRLAAQSPRVLLGGELVRVGRVWLEIRFDAATAPSAPQETKELALALVRSALASLGEDVEPRLVVVEGPDKGKTLALPAIATPYVLGRGHGVDLVLDETDASRRHVQLTRKGDGLLVRDLGSKNGCYLGETRLPAAQDTLWKGNESLRIGKDVFAFENPAATALAELERSADEPIREGEAIDAPSDDADAAEAEDAHASPAGGGAAPVAEVPRGHALTATKKPNEGWGFSDVVIVLVAGSVVVLSVIGLWLLFRGLSALEVGPHRSMIGAAAPPDRERREREIAPDEDAIDPHPCERHVRWKRVAEPVSDRREAVLPIGEVAPEDRAVLGEIGVPRDHDRARRRPSGRRDRGDVRLPLRGVRVDLARRLRGGALHDQAALRLMADLAQARTR